MIDRGAMTPNEWRAILNMAPIEGGDKPIRRLDTQVVNLLENMLNKMNGENYQEMTALMGQLLNIRGSMIPNSYAWYYDFFGEDYTCPKNVQNVLNQVNPGDEIGVYINSPGGVIDVGSEIYTLLRAAAEKHDVKIYITGEACSAASIVACAGYCEMAPTALMMVHCVSSGARGNHNDLEHMAEVPRTADRAMCTAYTEKTGMSEEEATAELINNPDLLIAAATRLKEEQETVTMDKKISELTPKANYVDIIKKTNLRYW